jgi:7-cyano-7-deazaguanine reductase
VSLDTEDPRLPLGKASEGSRQYAPELLYEIPRSRAREALGLGQGILPFTGSDIWHAYELSWLDHDGKPCVYTGIIDIPADSPNLVESKSLKLYLNSLNEHRFSSTDAAVETIRKDLSRATGAEVDVSVFELGDGAFSGTSAPGQCIDGGSLTQAADAPERSLLRVEEGAAVTETLHSHLLRSLCPVTAQPDWATVVIEYTGRRLERSALLSYIVAFRRHQGFHEQCVEQMFLDLAAVTEAVDLTVQALYTRRGGLDISPWRTTDAGRRAPTFRLDRQ